MEIITQNHTNNKPQTIRDFYKGFGIGKLLRKAGICKAKGIGVLRLFEIIFLLVFQSQNLYQAFSRDRDKQMGLSKDVVYRFLENTRNNWERFLMLLSSKAISEKISPLTGSTRIRAFVVDDTLYERNRSKKVELLSRLLDHNDNKYKRALQMLTLGWTDGNTFIPVAFRMMASAKKENQYCPSRDDLDRRTTGAKRRKKAIMGKPAMLLEMLNQAICAGIDASHVLFDSWFSAPESIHSIRAMGLEVVTMLKAMTWRCYQYRGSYVTLETLYRKTSSIKHGKTYGVYVHLKGKEGTIPVRIVFHRVPTERGWLALLSTDCSLTDSEILRLYGKRWSIEVFFKAAKSSFKLDSELQIRNFDAIVAHATIVCSRYIMFAVHDRFDIDQRAWGDLLFMCMSELIDISLAESLKLLLDTIATRVSDIFDIAFQRVKDCFASLVNDFRFHGFAGVRVCES